MNVSSSLFPVKRNESLFHIVATESYATLKYVVPGCLKWIWRKYFINEIRTIPLQITADNVSRVAYLNIHGKFPQIHKDQEVTPVLLCHGDFSHPCTMLHLADLSQKKGLPTFSLYISDAQNNEKNSEHNRLMAQAIDKIESLVLSQKGKFGGLLGTGHSKGAILLAQRKFVDLDKRIKAVCTINGRLKVPQARDCEDTVLRSIVQTIYQGIINHPTFPLVQIIAKDDWNASQESMAVRPQDHFYSVPGMHLSGLYANETRNYFASFLNEFSN